MAITATLQPAGVSASPTTKVWSVTATLDADTAAAVPHGMGALPGFDLTRVMVIAQPRTGAGRLSAWIVDIDATDITITKSTAVGSGDAIGSQMRLYMFLPHSLL